MQYKGDTKLATRGRIRVGDVVQVPLSGGTCGYGYVLVEPLIAFLDHRDGGQTEDFHDVVQKPLLFKIWVSNRPMRDGSWPVVGHVDPTTEALKPVPFFKQDAISRKLSITYDGGKEVPATPDDCRGLERAAVWEPEHVVDRLLDHFEGRPNKWVESLRMKD